MPPRLPAIPGYAIERLLGEGAFGKVFLAREESGLERPVALKVFARDHREDFEHELRMLKEIEEIRRRERALSIVQALGTGEHEDMPFIALEYLEDGSLADRIARSGPAPLETALRWTREAAGALQLLHGAGLFHRDVKPANLLLGRDGHVRLGDFGLSRSLDGTLSAAGSPAFAAPEVIAGKMKDGRVVDVYSLGATLVFLLTGDTFLPGRPDVFALERRGVPRSVQKLILAACTAAPEDRTPTIEALIRQLDAEIPENPRGKSSSPDESSEERDTVTGSDEKDRKKIDTRRRERLRGGAVRPSEDMPYLTRYALRAVVSIGVLLLLVVLRTVRNGGEIETVTVQRSPEIDAPAPAPRPPVTDPKRAETPRPKEAPRKLGGPELPWNPVSDAKVGDWARWSVATMIGGSGDGGDRRTTVTRVTDDEVTLLTVRNANGDTATEKGVERKLPRRAPVELARLLGISNPQAIASIQVAEESLEVGGRAFRCSRVSYVAKDDELGVEETRTKWFARDVKATGVVAERTEKTVGGRNVTTEVRLEGFGPDGATDWTPKAPVIVDAPSPPPSPGPSQAAAPGERASDFFPLGLESTWTYECRSGGRTFAVKRDIAFGGTTIRVRYGAQTLDFKIVNDEPCLVGRTTASGAEEFAPPCPLLRVGAAGSTWTWRGSTTLGKGGVTKATEDSSAFTLEAFEKVTVKAGSYECWRVREVGTSNTIVSWYAKGVGLVKEETTARDGAITTVELVNADARPTDPPRFGGRFGGGSGKRVGSSTVLPVNPFANARPGDWAVHVVRVEVQAEGKTTSIKPVVVKSTVTKVEGDAVTLETGVVPDDGESTAKDFSRSRAPRVEDLMEKKGQTVSDVRSVDEELTIGGRRFACKKITYEVAHQGLAGTTTLWISESARALGIVSMTVSMGDGAGSARTTMELAGYGTKDRLEWGKRPEDVKAK